MKSPLLRLLFLSALAFAFKACEIAKDRPILKIPDGNKDRREKEMFTGSKKDPKYWISKVTVSKASFEAPGLPFVFEGLQSQAKLGYFEFTRDKIKFHNMVNRQFLEDPKVASQGLNELINEWSIEHSEFRLAEVDGYTTNREEENDYISWEEKRYFTADWAKSDISEANTFPYSVSFSENILCWKKKTAYTIDPSREFKKDYIGWTVAVVYEQDPFCSRSLYRRNHDNYSTTVHYKYSFKSVPDPYLKDKKKEAKNKNKDENTNNKALKKASKKKGDAPHKKDKKKEDSSDKDYIPYVYDGEQDPLLRKYGYFRTIRPSIGEDGRDKNVFYMNRWNPNKKHIFYFSSDYPDKYKDLAYGVICHTNKLLAKHKLNNYPLKGACKEDGSLRPKKKETCSEGICFELRENKGEKLGDIRYSFFHLIERDAPIFGYGPSDTHPNTGEIISGNVIISTYALDFYLKYLVHDRYKRDHKDYYKESEGKKIKISTGKNKYDTSNLFVKMKQTLKENDHNLWTKSSKLIDEKSKIRPVFRHLVSQLTFGHPAYSGFTSSNHYGKDLSFSVKKLAEALPEPLAKQTQQILEQYHENQKKQMSHERNTTIYPLEPVIEQLPALLASGLTPEETKKRILFELISHEFGHVLGLRHNFYGSLDVFDGHDHSIKSSSVMDYLNLKDKATYPARSVFGSYDEAALVYAYSSGKKDLSKERQYLFCTDHHRSLNFLCNAWDKGQTPSEVMMSLIENYEESYFVRNLRLGRAYWDTSRYPYIRFLNMWDLKRALMMWRTAFRNNIISQTLEESKLSLTKDEISRISYKIQKDIRQAIKLSIAFYNSVLQTSESDKDWKDFYNEESGSIETIGISWDKLFAMFFLMGDDGFLYNPNHSLNKASYLTYINKLDSRQMIEEIMENTLTVRVDMQPWFIGFGRSLYAKNASNYWNISQDGALLEKIAVRCYTPKGLRDRFGINPYQYKANESSPPGFLDTAVILMEDYLSLINDAYYRGTNERLGITFFDGNYYVSASNLNKYTFTIIDQMKRVTHSDGDSLRLKKQYVYDMFRLYNLRKKGIVPQSCDNGD